MNVKEMTTEALEKSLEEVIDKIAKIKTQLDFAKAEAAVNGVYSDQNWFIRAKHALRMNGIEHQTILRELGNRRREKGQALNTGADRFFIQACKRRLDPVLFKELMAEAWEESRNANL
jgi:hypothetical protein